MELARVIFQVVFVYELSPNLILFLYAKLVPAQNLLPENRLIVKAPGMDQGCMYLIVGLVHLRAGVTHFSLCVYIGDK